MIAPDIVTSMSNHSLINDPCGPEKGNNQLSKRLRDCLRDSASLRAKAMRLCSGKGENFLDSLNEVPKQSNFKSPALNSPRKDQRSTFLGSELVTAESRLENELKFASSPGVSSREGEAIVKRKNYDQELPPLDFLPPSETKNELAIICSSMIIPVTSEGSFLPGENCPQPDFLGFFEKSSMLREVKETKSARISQQANAITMIARTRTFSTATRSFWEEFFLVCLLKSISKTDEIRIDITDVQSFLNAYHIVLGLNFHHEVVTSVSNAALKSSQSDFTELSTIARCTQHFVDCPDTSLNDFFSSTYPTKDFRYYVEVYCESFAARNLLHVADSEWLRIFHCLRAGRADAVLAYNSGFEGIHVIVEHLRSIESLDSFEVLNGGSEKIALLYRKELEVSGDIDQHPDPFKLAVLLYLSGKYASKEDVRSGLTQIYRSNVFTMTSPNNFLWLVLVFSSHVDMLYLVQELVRRHPVIRKGFPAEKSAVFIHPLAHKPYPLDHSLFFHVLQQSYLEGLSLVKYDDDLIPYALFFMLMILDDPSHPLQSTTFWRDHLLVVLNNPRTVGDPKSTRIEENALFSGLKKAISPLQSIITDVFSGSSKPQKESYSVIYAVKLLNLFSIEQKADLIAELHLAKLTGDFRDPENIFTNIDSTGIRTSKFFNYMVRYASSNCGASEEEYHRPVTNLMIRASDRAEKLGFGNVSIHLLVDAYVFLAHQAIPDEEVEKDLLNDITQKLMREIQKNSYRNTFNMIDVASLLREFLRANSERIDVNVYHEYLTFHRAVGIYQHIQDALQRSQKSGNTGLIFSSKVAMREYIKLMDTDSVRSLLEKSLLQFEEMYVLVRDENDLSKHGTWKQSSLRDCCLIFIHWLLAVQDPSQTKFFLRSHVDLHTNVTRFLVWARRIANHMEDDGLLQEIQSLSREFLGQTNLS